MLSLGSNLRIIEANDYFRDSTSSKNTMLGSMMADEGPLSYSCYSDEDLINCK
jgi:hypothetical protein